MENLKYLLLINIAISLLVILALNINIIIHETFNYIIKKENQPIFIQHLATFTIIGNIIFSLSMLTVNNKNFINPSLLVVNLIVIILGFFIVYKHIKVTEELIVLKHLLEQTQNKNRIPKELPWIEAYYNETNNYYKFLLKYISKDMHQIYLEKLKKYNL